MQHLQELGLDTSSASMVFGILDDDSKYLLPNDQDIFERCVVTKYIPAYTLQDIMKLLPTELKQEERRLWLRIDLSDECFYYYYDDCNLVEHRKKVIGYDGVDGLIDAAYSMLCWAIENGYVKTEKEEK